MIVLVRLVMLGLSISLLPIVSLRPAPAIAASHSAELQTFETETAAQAHCPRDVVVWLNLPTGIYHEKGMRWYGHTKHGAYVCHKEADSAGDRDTRNGQ